MGVFPVMVSSFIVSRMVSFKCNVRPDQISNVELKQGWYSFFKILTAWEWGSSYLKKKIGALSICTKVWQDNDKTTHENTKFL